MPQVSIVVVTYNANIEKLCRTLHAAAMQKDVDFEIIIADDGSTQKDFSFVKEFLQTRGVTAFRIVENPYNQGTVKNCISGIRSATGEYIFLTSPGDMLYDAYVLRDFYCFSKKHHANMCFGNPVYYRADASGVRLTKQECVPIDPRLYSPDASLFQEQVSFLSNYWPVGATYFRQREFALKYLETVSEQVVYLEDNSSTAFALADGHKLYYFNRNIVWYEDGSGISTGANDKWARLLAKDTESFILKLKETHPRSSFADVFHCNYLETNRFRRIAHKLLRHPLILFYARRIKKTITPQDICCSETDFEYLRYLHTHTTQGN